ncbi:MAG: shikimate dehydrogenase [Lachnospiraceae bacterium]|nr:shikimate dehydrogenase [Lachnospiraceae bacterium]
MGNKNYCVIGTPVGHSRSPELYRKIFDEKGLFDHTYVINEIKTETELKAFFDDVRAGKWDGCNVTMPWKTLAAEQMDELLPNAALTQAVNTVVRLKDRLIGDSTDGGGMCDAIEQDTGISIEGKNVVILGCGGAARSIIAELALRRAEKVSVFCRPGRNRELTEELKGRILVHLDSIETTCVEQIEHKDREDQTLRNRTSILLLEHEDAGLLSQAVGEADILINCTPLGMIPHEDELPLSEEITFPQKLIVADSIYNPEETLLIKKADAQDCRTVRGFRMLEEQAVRAARLYLR